ncbi:hypothetical protein PanWU01x14_341430 [Parasponia andersonii]|uniref:Transmembrane protein n=1 Tax=Parasponia andersonii TaxID=3476 RepID=A0A2P5AE57_PARAD|nr:hypothetical protein PanWU01x14_341430 [Parasponia andersonii]
MPDNDDLSHCSVIGRSDAYASDSTMDHLTSTMIDDQLKSERSFLIYGNGLGRVCHGGRKYVIQSSLFEGVELLVFIAYSSVVAALAFLPLPLYFAEGNFLLSRFLFTELSSLD